MKKQSKSVAPLAGAIAAAVAVFEAPVTVIRKPSAIAEFIAFGADGSASFEKGSNITADELAGYVVDGVATAASQSVRLANALRLARQLPDVVEGDKKTKAFEYVSNKVERETGSRFAFSNIRGLVEVLDLRDKVPALSNAAVGAVKDSLGYFRKLNLLDEEKGGFKPGVESDPVFSALKTGTGNNALRPVLDSAKALRRDVFPLRTKGAVAAPAGTTSTGVVLGTDDTSKIALELALLLGRADKLAAVGKLDRKALRTALAPLNVMANAPEKK